MAYRAEPCPCGQRACRDWHVSNVAAVQGVNFTQEQAEAVAGLLNAMGRGGQADEVSNRARRRREILERASGVTDDTVRLEFGDESDVK